jgi:protein-disulfide isomerase
MPPDEQSGAIMRAEGGPAVVATGSSATIADHFLPGGILQWGDSASPVSLLLFTNHSCKYCADFQREIVPRLLLDFVEDGKLRISLIPFPLRKYPESREAVRVLLCAASQDKGTVMNEMLFSSPKATDVRSILQNAGLDAATLAECLGSPQTDWMLDAHESFAQTLGVTLVPTLFLNGERIVGLPEYADLQGQIEQMLSEME